MQTFRIEEFENSNPTVPHVEIEGQETGASFGPPGSDVRSKQDQNYTETEFLRDLDQVSQRQDS